MATRRQHYVWRHYLEGWQAEDGLVSSLIGDKVVRTNPLNVMVERDFYSLHALSRADVQMLRALLLREETPPYLRHLHENLIRLHKRVSDLQQAIRRAPSASSHDKASMRDVALQIEERMHSQIEADAVPVLQALRNRDGRVIHSDATAPTFFHFVSQQYMRTKPIRDRVEGVLAEIMSPPQAARIRHLYCHCLATNMGASLYGDREDLELLFVDAPADERLITGDHPMVNVLGTDDGSQPLELALYYPLSPALGVILAPKALATPPVVGDPNARIAALNDLIAARSERILVADSPTFLRRYATDPALRSPGPALHLPPANSN